MTWTNYISFGVCIIFGCLSKIACEMGYGKEVQNLCYDFGTLGIVFILMFLLFLQTKSKYLWLAGLILIGMDISNLFLNNFKITFVHGVCLYSLTALIIYYGKKRKWLE